MKAVAMYFRFRVLLTSYMLRRSPSLAFPIPPSIYGATTPYSICIYTTKEAIKRLISTQINLRPIRLIE